jgi:hypothetical protein
MGLFDGMTGAGPDPAQAADTPMGDSSQFDMAKFKELMNDPKFVQMVMQLGKGAQPASASQPKSAMQQMAPMMNMMGSGKTGGLGGLGGLSDLFGGGSATAANNTTGGLF